MAAVCVVVEDLPVAVPDLDAEREGSEVKNHDLVVFCQESDTGTTSSCLIVAMRAFWLVRRRSAWTQGAERGLSASRERCAVGQLIRAEKLVNPPGAEADLNSPQFAQSRCLKTRRPRHAG
jgi:hypothetical protein